MECGRCHQDSKAPRYILLDPIFGRIVRLCNVCYDSWQELLKRQKEERAAFADAGEGVDRERTAMPKLTKTVTTVIDVNELGQILIEHYEANTVIIRAVKVGDPGSPEIIPVGILGGLDIEVDIVVERDREI